MELSEQLVEKVKAGAHGEREKIPTGQQQEGKRGRWYPGGNIARRATSNGGVENGASSKLIAAPSSEIHFCPSNVSSDKFRLFLIENEFSIAENEEVPGVEDAIPLVDIMVLVQGVMLLSWVCNMAPALRRQALKLTCMIIDIVSHKKVESLCRRYESYQQRYQLHRS